LHFGNLQKSKYYFVVFLLHSLQNILHSFQLHQVMSINML
jgi:hypothetical protein